MSRPMHPASRILWVGLAVCVVLASLASATSAKDRDEGLVVLNLPRDYVDIESLLRVMSHATRTPMVWNPADMRIRGKRLTAGTDVRMPMSELWPAMRSVLFGRGLVLVPVGPVGHQVWIVMDARRTSTILKPMPQLVELTNANLEQYADRDGLYVSAVIRVEHLEDYAAARTALMRLITGQNIGNVTQIPDAKAFVVTDFAPKVVACYRTLKELDQPPPKHSTTKGRTVAVPVEHAKAADLARTLTQHYPDQRITADERTNRLLLTGTEKQVEVLRRAAGLLDVRVLKPQTMLHVLPLKHAAASKAASAVLALVRGTPALWSSAAPPTVVPHDGTLLVAATKEDFGRILGLVEGLDRVP